jgi:hypothetical protein
MISNNENGQTSVPIWVSVRQSAITPVGPRKIPYSYANSNQHWVALLPASVRPRLDPRHRLTSPAQYICPEVAARPLNGRQSAAKCAVTFFELPAMMCRGK